METTQETNLSLETRLKLYQAILEIIQNSHDNNGFCTICAALKFTLHDLLIRDDVYAFPEIMKYKPKKARPNTPWWPLHNMQRRINVMVEVIEDTEHKLKGLQNPSKRKQKLQANHFKGY